MCPSSGNAPSAPVANRATKSQATPIGADSIADSIRADLHSSWSCSATGGATVVHLRDIPLELEEARERHVSLVREYTQCRHTNSNNQAYSHHSTMIKEFTRLGHSDLITPAEKYLGSDSCPLYQEVLLCLDATPQICAREAPAAFGELLCAFTLAQALWVSSRWSEVAKQCQIAIRMWSVIEPHARELDPQFLVNWQSGCRMRLVLFAGEAYVCMDQLDQAIRTYSIAISAIQSEQPWTVHVTSDQRGLLYDAAAEAVQQQGLFAIPLSQDLLQLALLYRMLAVQSCPDDVCFYTHCGQTHAWLHQDEEAERYMLTGLILALKGKEDSRIWKQHLIYAIFLQQQQRWAAALIEFVRSYDLRSTPAAMCGIAEMNKQLGDLHDAALWHSRTLQAEPRHLPTLFTKALESIGCKEFPSALDLLDTVLQVVQEYMDVDNMGPQDSVLEQVLKLLARIYVELRYFDEAAVAFLRAAECAVTAAYDSRACCLADAANAYWDAGELKLARTYFEKSLAEVSSDCEDADELQQYLRLALLQLDKEAEVEHNWSSATCVVHPEPAAAAIAAAKATMRTEHSALNTHFAALDVQVVEEEDCLGGFQGFVLRKQVDPTDGSLKWHRVGRNQGHPLTQRTPRLARPPTLYSFIVVEPNATDADGTNALTVYAASSGHWPLACAIRRELSMREPDVKFAGTIWFSEAGCVGGWTNCSGHFKPPAWLALSIANRTGLPHDRFRDISRLKQVLDDILKECGGNMHRAAQAARTHIDVRDKRTVQQIASDVGCRT